MNVSDRKMVKIHYTLKDESGNLIDSSEGGEPLEYMHGTGALIPGLERELEGRAEGERFSAKIEAKDGYGEYKDEYVVEVHRERFDVDAPIEAGQQFQADTPTGPMIVRVLKVSGDTITIDSNHEFAGKTLFVDAEVVSVREATKEELAPFEREWEGGCGGSCSSCASSCATCGGECF